LGQLRGHFEAQFNRRREMMAEAAQKSSEFETALRKFVIEHEALKLRYQQESRESAERDQENRQMQIEMRALESRNATLETKLAKYERDAKQLQNQENQLKKREQEMAAQVAAMDQKLRAVREIFERTGTPMAAIQAGTPRASNQEGGGSASRAANDAGGNRPKRRLALSPPPKSSIHLSGGLPPTPMGLRSLMRVNQVNVRGNNHRRSQSVDNAADVLAKSMDEENRENSFGQKRKADDVEVDQFPGDVPSTSGNVKKGKF